MISAPSVVNAVVLYSIVVLFVCLFRRWTGFLKCRGVPILLFVCALATLRLFVPIEIPCTYVVNSWDVFGAAQSFFYANPETTQRLLRAWAGGMIVAVGVALLLLGYTYHKYRNCVKVENELVQQIARKLSITCPVIVTPDVEGPCVMGLFRYTIFLPNINLSERELELALIHERQHIRSGDSKIKLVISILTVALWWNLPVLWFWWESGNLLELWCDARVIKNMNNAERVEYVKMLKHVAEEIVNRKQAPKPLMGVFRATGKKSTIYQRCDVILAKKGRIPQAVKTFVQYVFLTLFFALFLASYLVIVQPASAPSVEEFQNDSRTFYHEDYDDSEVENVADDIFIYKGSDGRYKLFINYAFIRYLSDYEITLDEYRELHIFEEVVQK